MNPDVIIIGGGLIGSSTALQLAMTGKKVTVIEKDQPGRHASGVNAGGLRQLNRHTAEIPLTIAAAEIWQNIKSLVDSDCDTQLNGQVRVAEDDADIEKLEKRISLLQSFGFNHEKLIGKSKLYELIPDLSPHCKGALYVASDGCARPYHVLTAFRRKAQSLGVTYITNCKVLGIKLIKQFWHLKSSQRDFTAPVVVNCAGAWAKNVCELIDEPVPLKVGAPMMMVTERLAHFLKPVVGAVSQKLSFKQMLNGTVLIGGAYLADHDFDRQTTEIDFEKLISSCQTVLSLFPKMANVRIVRAWAGLEAFMPDNIPVIGPSRTVNNFYHAFGFSAHGFQLSPIIGRMMSELINHGNTSLPIEPFAINRFAKL